jgi:hypothetical protein
MYEWETRLTTRDENRVVRPLEWGFEWMSRFLRRTALAPPSRARGCARPALPKPPWCASTSSSSATATSSSATSGPRTFASKSASAALPHQCAAGDAGQDAAIKQQAAEGKLPRRSFCASPRRSARRTRKRPGERALVSRRPRTRIPRGPSRPLWCCRSGTPTASATTRCAPSSTAWAFRRCGSPCPTTTFAGRRSWSAPTTRSAPTSAAPLRLPPGGGRYPLLPRLA